MSLFNIKNYDNEDDDEFNEYEEIKCQCEHCSVENTVEIVENFTEDMLNAQSVEHLQEMLYQFAEFSKIQGIKEYLFETVKLQQDTLYGLDVYTDNVLGQGSDNTNDFKDYGNHGGTDIPHWKDRL